MRPMRRAARAEGPASSGGRGDDSFPRMPSLDRRSFLAAGLATAVGTACGTEGTTSAPDAAGPAFTLIASFPRSEPYAPVGARQRLPFLIADRDGAPLDRIDGSVAFTVTTGGRTVGSAVTVAPRATGIPRAYLPLEFTFPDTGIYEIRARYRGTDLTAAIQAYPPAEVKLPQIGSALVPVSTPTVSDHRGVEPICTREPPCPFHQIDLATSLAAHRPVALLLSTPKYCQTAICGPVLDVLIDESAHIGGVDVIHAEVYANPDAVTTIADAKPTELVSAYSMSFEPCLFVTKADGTLVRRLDTIYDRTELREALAAAI